MIYFYTARYMYALFTKSRRGERCRIDNILILYWVLKEWGCYLWSQDGEKWLELVIGWSWLQTV